MGNPKMMKKPFLNKIYLVTLTLFTFFLVSCGDIELNNKIPETELSDAVFRVHIVVEKNDSDRKGGGTTATGVVPFDIKRDQVRPTLLAVIKAIMKKFPKSEMITVALSPDQAMAQAGLVAGRAVYYGKDGKIMLYYGVPADQDINEWNDTTGKPSSDNKKALNNTRLYRPDSKAFETAKKVFTLYEKYETEWQNDKNPDKISLADFQKRAYANISKELSLSQKEAVDFHNFLKAYYSTGRGEEVYKLQ